MKRYAFEAETYDEFLLLSERCLNENYPPGHPYRQLMIRYYDVVAYQEWGVPFPDGSKPVEIPFRY